MMSVRFCVYLEDNSSFKVDWMGIGGMVAQCGRRQFQIIYLESTMYQECIKKNYNVKRKRNQ